MHAGGPQGKVINTWNEKVVKRDVYSTGVVLDCILLCDQETAFSNKKFLFRINNSLGLALNNYYRKYVCLKCCYTLLLFKAEIKE